MATSTIKGVDKQGQVFYQSWVVRKRGDICFLTTSNFENLPAGAFSIGTIDEAFRPRFDTSFTVVRRSSNASATIAIVVQADGIVRGYNYGPAISGAVPAGDTFCYPLD